jgi:hypothetical protein
MKPIVTLVCIICSKQHSIFETPPSLPEISVEEELLNLEDEGWNFLQNRYGLVVASMCPSHPIILEEEAPKKGKTKKTEENND